MKQEVVQWGMQIFVNQGAQEFRQWPSSKDDAESFIEPQALPIQSARIKNKDEQGKDYDRKLPGPVVLYPLLNSWLFLQSNAPAVGPSSRAPDNLAAMLVVEPIRPRELELGQHSRSAVAHQRPVPTTAVASRPGTGQCELNRPPEMHQVAESTHNDP